MCFSPSFSCIPCKARTPAHSGRTLDGSDLAAPWLAQATNLMSIPGQSPTTKRAPIPSPLASRTPALFSQGIFLKTTRVNMHQR